MELGIKGHKTRSHEVIDLLKMLGGINRYKVIGGDDKYFYYICDKYKDISNSYIGPDEIKGYEIFSLEDFLEKFPYKVGDKVEFWSEVDYYGRTELETSEIKSMRWNSARCEIAYRMKDITGEFYKEDIKGKVTDDEEQQIDSSIDYYKVVENEVYEEVEKKKIEITMDTLFRAGITIEYLKECGCELPDGYHFTDENGNVIDAKKIQLVKNASSYPKTYDECCKIIGYFLTGDTIIGHKTPLLRNFQKLLVCRDAYWKIAGEELGLGKSWEYDHTKGYYTPAIIYRVGFIQKVENLNKNVILAFPTIEMRNAFYENFKELIEQCKELL